MSVDATLAPEDPLDWLAGVHAELRAVCTLLERLIGGATVDAGERHAAAAFVGDVLPMHLRDEEEDLFPLLRRRCTEEDEIGRILGVLGAEHGQEGEHTARVVAILARTTLTASCRRTLVAFTRQQREHVAIEDGVVLPIARMRLGRRDLATLRGRMVARRAQLEPNFAR
jgi:hemerythrin-like domain-containing protein